MNHFYEHPTFADSPDSELFDDLEVRCKTNVAEVRKGTNHQLRVRVEVEAGNVCDRERPLATLHTGEISELATAGIADQPVMVGSVFQLRFDRATLDVNPTFAVCERCTMLGDSSFELRFRFTQPLDLSDD